MSDGALTHGQHIDSQGVSTTYVQKKLLDIYKIENNFLHFKVGSEGKKFLSKYQYKDDSKIQLFFYVLLYFILILSISLFTLALFSTYNSQEWEIFRRFYILGLLFFTWYNFILLFIGDIVERRFPKYRGELISVVIPCYNERFDLFERSINSVIKAYGKKEIIVVNDGSVNNIKPLINKYKKKGVKVHHFSVNKGKRQALHYAVKNLLDPNSSFVVTIDSDTVLKKNALIRVVEPLKVKNTGAATGDVRVLNEKENWLTRLASAYYWVSLNLHRKSQSALGQVDCCSGAIAAYKTSVMQGFIDQFVTQEFMGQKCTFSEDRHLTNLVLKNNYNVYYVPDAVVYTESPTTFKGFLKQQLRWKRGYIRESTYTLSYAWRNRKLLFFQVLFWDLTSPFLTFGFRVMLLLLVIFMPKVFLFHLLPSILIFLCVRNVFIFYSARRKVPGLFMYMFVYEFVLYWMSLYALITINKKGWITR